MLILCDNNVIHTIQYTSQFIQLVILYNPIHSAVLQKKVLHQKLPTRKVKGGICRFKDYKKPNFQAAVLHKIITESIIQLWELLVPV